MKFEHITPTSLSVAPEQAPHLTEFDIILMAQPKYRKDQTERKSEFCFESQQTTTTAIAALANRF